MFAFHNVSIRNKIRIIIMLTTGVVLLLSSIAFMVNDMLTFRRNMVQDLFTLAELVGANSIAGLLFDIPDTAEENIEGLKVDPQIVFTLIFDEEGNLFASYYQEGVDTEKLPNYNTLKEYYLLDAELEGENVAAEAELHIKKEYFVRDDYIDVFREILSKGKHVGTVYIRSDVQELNSHLLWSFWIMLVILIISLAITFLLASRLQQVITTPLYALLKVITRVSASKDYSSRATKTGRDEIGNLIDGFNEMLENIERRDHELAQANNEITTLNARLKEENFRMGAELEISQRLQQMVLPRKEELMRISGLDIVGFMEAADEVGGDYYDVIQYGDRVKIGIGDVTGHGLESGVLMLMVQTAVRSLLSSNIRDMSKFINALNETIFANVKRMNSEKNLTLSIIEYQDGQLKMTGQHEEVLVVRKGGRIERIDTFDLGFMIGVVADISKFVSELEIHLEPEDGVVLYTDGITEAHDLEEEQYSVERLCDIVSKNWHLNSQGVQDAVVTDLHRHIGGQKLQDDITLLVIKRVA